MPCVHVREPEPCRVHQALVDLTSVSRARVEHAQGGWTSVHLADGRFAEAGAAALELSILLTTDAVAAEAGARGLRMRHAREGAWCCAHLPPEDDAPAPVPAIGLPGRSRALHEQARAFVDAMSRQQASEVAANVAWLRRHAAALGIEPPGRDDPSRREEAALMRRARAAIREAVADPAVEAARRELDERLTREREAFFALADAHRDLLGLPPIPDPATGSEAYFASVMDAVGRVAVASLAEGADPQVPAAVARHVRELGLSPDRLLARTLPHAPFAWLP